MEPNKSASKAVYSDKDSESNTPNHETGVGSPARDSTQVSPKIDPTPLVSDTGLSARLAAIINEAKAAFKLPREVFSLGPKPFKPPPLPRRTEPPKLPLFQFSSSPPKEPTPSPEPQKQSRYVSPTRTPTPPTRETPISIGSRASSHCPSNSINSSLTSTLHAKHSMLREFNPFPVSTRIHADRQNHITNLNLRPVMFPSVASSFAALSTQPSLVSARKRASPEADDSKRTYRKVGPPVENSPLVPQGQANTPIIFRRVGPPVQNTPAFPRRQGKVTKPGHQPFPNANPREPAAAHNSNVLPQKSENQKHLGILALLKPETDRFAVRFNDGIRRIHSQNKGYTIPTRDKVPANPNQNQGPPNKGRAFSSLDKFIVRPALPSGSEPQRAPLRMHTFFRFPTRIESSSSAWDEETFELREAKFLMELDRDYHQPKPASPKRVVRPIKSEILERAHKVRDHLRSYTRLSLNETKDPKITGHDYTSVRVLRLKSIAPQSATAICEVSFVGATNVPLCRNDKNFSLKVGDKVLVTFMVAIPSECAQSSCQAKKAKVKKGATIKIHSPAMKVASFDKVSAVYKSYLLAYRFSFGQAKPKATTSPLVSS